VGQIELKVSEPDAVVLLDDKEVGRAPLGRALDADVGTHTIVVKKEGFEPFQQETKVTGQTSVTVDAVLEKEIVTAKLVVTETAGQPVHVMVDGNDVGPAPWEGTLPLGPHDVSVQSPSWRSEITKVELAKRKVAEVAITAIATVGRIEVSTVDGKGVVRIDGKVVGEGRFSDELPVGPHVVTVQRDGYKPFERKLTLEAGQTASVSIALELATPAPAKEPPDNGTGIFGGLLIAGSFQAGDTGNQGDFRCSDLGASCSTSAPKGGGLFGAVGYMWNPIGVDLLFGATGDVGTLTVIAPATAGGGTSAYDIWRMGAVAALRLRAQVQSSGVRGTLSVGPTIAERFAGTQSVSTDYAAFGVMGDAQVAFRVSRSTAFAIGFMFWGEKVGDGVTVTARGSAAPFHLASGTQFLMQPHLGLEFGP
jgi:hypothetical protein